MDTLDAEGSEFPQHKVPAPSQQMEDLGIPLEQIREVLQTMPNATMRDVLMELTKDDPLVWSMLHRKLSGQTFICDNSKNLTVDALRKLKGSLKNQKKYLREKKARQRRHRPYLAQPLRDDHPHKVYMKGRQVGGTEIEISEVLWFLAVHDNTKAVVTFPREKNLLTFVNTRCNPALQETPAIKRLVGSPNQTEMKKIGESFLIFRSSWEAALGEGVDADMLVLDEKDRMNANVEHAFKDSLSASKFGWIRELSTPSLPGQGIDFQFGKSDQKMWLVRCERCNLEQPIDWQENIVQVKEVKQGSREIQDGAYEYQCRLQKCRGPLDRMRGRWVAKRPSIKDISGYHMPQMLFLLAGATDIMRKKVDGRPLQAWLNYEVGVASSGDSVLINEKDYEEACSGHPLLEQRTSDWLEVTVGIDWGHWNWVTVLGLNSNGRVYLIGLFIVEDDPQEPMGQTKKIIKYLAPFQPDLVLADDGYGKDRNALLLNHYGEDRFYACRYNTEVRSKKALESGRQGAKGRYRPQWGTPESALVIVDKTTELKKTCHMVKEKELGVPDYDQPGMSEWKAHFKNLVPMAIEDHETGELLEVVSRKGDDHLANATSYARIAMVRLAQLGQFQFVGV